MKTILSTAIDGDCSENQSDQKLRKLFYVFRQQSHFIIICEQWRLQCIHLQDLLTLRMILEMSNPGSWRSDNINTGFQDVTQTSSNRYSIPASNVRDNYMEYFTSEEGAVAWQK